MEGLPLCARQMAFTMWLDLLPGALVSAKAYIFIKSAKINYCYCSIGCADYAVPGAYVNVQTYLPWIENNMQY